MSLVDCRCILPISLSRNLHSNNLTGWERRYRKRTRKATELQWEAEMFWEACALQLSNVCIEAKIELATLKALLLCFSLWENMISYSTQQPGPTEHSEETVSRGQPSDVSKVYPISTSCPQTRATEEAIAGRRIMMTSHKGALRWGSMWNEKEQGGEKGICRNWIWWKNGLGRSNEWLE